MNYRRLFIEGSYIFLTIVTNNRKKILIENIKLLREAFENAEKYFDFEFFAISILPDHFHILLKPEEIKDYPKIITSIKYYFSKRFDVVGLESPTYVYTNSSTKKVNTYDRSKGIWQRRYYEHTIRDEEDLRNHLDYIHYNPVKHGYCQNVKDWEFSSFHKFVTMNYYEEDWGSMKDVINIDDLDYE